MERALVGPFHWVAPTTNFGDGHKCVLASSQATGENAPANPTDAPKSPQVAQRNLRLTQCAFPLTNGATTDGNLTLTLTVPKGVTPNLSYVGMTFTDPNVPERRIEVASELRGGFRRGNLPRR